MDVLWATWRCYGALDSFMDLSRVCQKARQGVCLERKDLHTKQYMMAVYVGANVWARVESRSLIGAVRKIAEATQVPFGDVYTEQTSWGWNVWGPDGPFGTVVIEPEALEVTTEFRHQERRDVSEPGSIEPGQPR
jgi:hypothetical protein